MRQVSFAFAKTWDKNVLFVHGAYFPGFPGLDLQDWLEIPGFPWPVQILYNFQVSQILFLKKHFKKN